MSNINDYLIWRGDIPIVPGAEFNEIDSMILARFSYLLFDRINLQEQETIESISNKMKNFKNEEFNYNGDKDLITNLGQSLRFKNMITTDYVKNNNEKIEKQFSAITVHISENEMYISFLGTDKTILGWKEDFNLSFMKNIPAQIDGLKYVEKIAKKFPNKKIRIGGHSKGGNVAVYSAIESTKDIQDRIIKIYNYDGPGFDKKTVESNKNKDIIKKVRTYIPQDSIIGRILEHEEKYQVVQSIEKGIYQHDIYSWQVLGNKMIKEDKVTDSSELINETIREWLQDTTPEQRKIFFDGVFEIFYSTEARTFGEINIKSIPAIIKTYRDISEKDRKIIIEMLKVFIKTYLENLKEIEMTKYQFLAKFNKQTAESKDT